MKTPEKNQKKQGSSDTHGSKAPADKNKQAANKDKGAWKNPDPTHPKKSPEKINEPYAKTASTFPDTKTSQTPGVKKEKITNAGESEHHIPVNKSDYDKFEDEYEDFELDTDDEEEEEEEDEDGEANSHYEYEEEEDEDRQFRSQVPVNQKNQVPLNQKSQVPLNQKSQVPVNQKKVNEQNKLHQPTNKTFENKNKSQLPSNSAAGKNKKNPQA
jgi:hypothetical protein